MANCAFTTKLSRRTMLAGGGAAAATTFAVPAVFSATPPPAIPVRTVPFPVAASDIANPADARLLLLATEYRRVLAALDDWTGRAERQDSILAYMDPAYRARCAALWARADGLVAEIARVRPDSVFGLAVKLRAGTCYDSTGDTPLDCDQRLLFPGLADLDRLAEAALFGAG